MGEVPWTSFPVRGTENSKMEMHSRLGSGGTALVGSVRAISLTQMPFAEESVCLKAGWSKQT